MFSTVLNTKIIILSTFILLSALCFKFGPVLNFVVWLRVNPLPDDKILDWSKLKQSADDNFKFDENSRKFTKQVENTVGKG